MDRRAVLRRAARRLGRDESFQEQFGSSPNSKALAHSGCRRLYWNKVSYYVDRDRNSEFRYSPPFSMGDLGQVALFPLRSIWAEVTGVSAQHQQLSLGLDIYW